VFGGDLGFEATYVVVGGIWQSKQGVYDVSCGVVCVQGLDTVLGFGLVIDKLSWVKIGF
jgi:hypothetical protein